MFDTSSISYQIRNSISSSGSSEKARWLENYVKHNIVSKGTSIPKIREIVKSSNLKYGLEQLSINDQLKLLSDLISKKFTEDKLAAIIYLQLYWIDKYNEEKLRAISTWFNNEWINDWNVCDWLCVRILTPMVDVFPDIIIPQLMTWNNDNNLWKARASVVPFAQAKTLKSHQKTALKLAKVLIEREERFCKTATGWVLREISKFDEETVGQFLSMNENHLTKEVVHNATKYIR